MTEEADSSSRARRRGFKAAYLILFLPLILVGLVGYAIFRPVKLQVGPMMLLTAPVPNAGAFKGVMSKSLPPGQPLNGVDGRSYAVTRTGRVVAVPVGDQLYAIAWFQGHRN